MSPKDRDDDDTIVARGATLYSKKNKSKKQRDKKPVDLQSAKNTVYNRTIDPEFEDEVINYLSKAGIEVSSYKRRYILRRLRVRMGRLKINSYKEYHKYLQNTPMEISEIQRSLSINVTRFFRNRDTFDTIKKDILPHLIRNKKSIKIWSAGCAVGAEPYTIAMIANDIVPRTLNLTILATDVKDELLRIARSGTYSESYLGELNDAEISKYFNQTKSGDYQVKPHIKSLVTFNKHDLMKNEYPGNMDIIICRNVLIYVDRTAQNQILNKFLHALKPNGLLVLGRTETLFGDFRKSVEIVSTKHRIYRKKASGFEEISNQTPMAHLSEEIRKIKKTKIKTRQVNTGLESTTTRLEELRDFRKTFEERKRLWEERLDRSRRERELHRKKVENDRKLQRRRSELRRPTSTRAKVAPTRNELHNVREKGSLSDYRALLKRSAEPTRISRVRKDLDKEE